MIVDPFSSDAQDRRRFLKAVAAAGGALLAAGCAASGTRPATAAAQPSAGASTADTPAALRSRIGLQLYTVRDQMQKDVAATLERVAQIGYREVEFAGYFNHSPQELRALLDRLGLRAPSAHVGLDALQKDLGAQVQAARVIGHEYLTVPALMEPLMGRPVGPDYWQRTAAEFNRIARAVKGDGIGFAYHNHTFEFEPLPDGRTGYDVLLAETDPALVQFELDLLWATFAGQDPVAMFRRNPGRFVMWHVKDIRGLADARREAAAASGGAIQKMQAAMPRLAAVGTGDIDFRRIFAEASTAGLRYFFVENDAAPNTPSSLGNAETSYQNLTRILA